MNVAAVESKPPTPPISESAILRQHEPLIRFMAMPFVHGNSLEDLMQEGRLALLLCLRTWREESGVKLWTFARRRVFGAMCNAVTKEVAASRTTDDVEEAIDEGPEEKYALCELLAKLTEQERSIVKMYFEEDLDFRAIAARTGLSKSNVDRIFRGAIVTMRVALGSA